MSLTYFEGEDVIITFEKEGADTAYNVECRITNINISGGTGEVETIRTFGGCSIQVNKPSSDYEVSFDYVTRDAFFSEVNFDDSASQGPTSGTEYKSGTEAGKKRWRVILWFLGDGAGVSKSGNTVVPLNTGEILRYIFKDCYSVSNEESFASDGHMTGTITIKCGSADENGYGNVIKEWTAQQGTTALTTLTTTSHGGALTWNTTTPAWTASYRT